MHAPAPAPSPASCDPPRDPPLDVLIALVEGGHMLPVTQPEVTAGFIASVADARLALVG